MKKLLFSLPIILLSLSAFSQSFERQELQPGTRVNSIGFLPQTAKVATVVGATESVSGFKIVDTETGNVVFSGDLGAKKNHQDSGETVRLADFSAFEETGHYQLIVDGLPDSASFRIDSSIYNPSLYLNMIGFYGQRCGEPVSLEHNGVTFSKKACHLDDGYLDFYDPERKGEIKDATGGWHDAGDYGKYIVNGAFATGMMLKAWEDFGDKLVSLELPIPEANGDLPDYLAEVKFNIDWMLKMQFEDGRVSHKLTRQNFSPMIMPSEDEEKRFFVDWGTDATYCFAAVMAQAARIYKPYNSEYADICAEAAKAAMEANRKQWWDHMPDQSQFRTGGYQAPSKSDRKWALIEYWELTGDPELESLIYQTFNNDNYVVDVDFDWGRAANLGAITYLNSKREKDPRVLQTIKSDMILAADRVLDQIQNHGYGRGLRNYYWGSNGSVARLAFNLYAAYQLTGDAKYYNAIVSQLDYLYGRNPYARSFVTGEGHRPPMLPHHRPSHADGITPPWPGHLVGGANPTELDWHDVMEDPRTNENAINWDAALSYALAIFYNPE